MLPEPGTTDRTKVNRLKERSVQDRELMYEILDSSLLCHVGYVEGDQPFVLPFGYARAGDRILLHGSSGSRFMRALSQGAPTCITVTKLDGMVVARTNFDSSMNYRSVVILGKPYEITGEEKSGLLDVLSDAFLPGRSKEVRKATAKELAATTLIALDLNEASVKIRNGQAYDDEGSGTGVWSGVIPLSLVAEAPIPSDAEASDLAVPESVLQFLANPKG